MCGSGFRSQIFSFPQASRFYLGLGLGLGLGALSLWSRVERSLGDDLEPTNFTYLIVTGSVPRSSASKHILDKMLGRCSSSSGSTVLRIV